MGHRRGELLHRRDRAGSANQRISDDDEFALAESRCELTPCVDGRDHGKAAYDADRNPFQVEEVTCDSSGPWHSVRHERADVE